MATQRICDHNPILRRNSPGFARCPLAPGALATNSATTAKSHKTLPIIPVVGGIGLFGAFLESPVGDVFVKLTGPAALVRPAAADFEAMIQSPF